MVRFVGAQRGVVAVSIAIAVDELAALVGEVILLVRPSIAVLVWTAKGGPGR